MPGEIGIIVQARMSSSRFPGKSLRKIGGEPLIGIVLRRLQLTNLPIYVCTSDDPSDDRLYNYVKTEGFTCFRGSLNNVLERYIQTAEAFGVDKIIRVTGDNPLVDIHYLIESLSLFNKFHYVDGIYSGGLIKGAGFELVTLTELKRITSTRTEHLEHVTSWLRENLTLSDKRVRLKPNKFNYHREGLYLTCDYQEDFELLQRIFEYFELRVNMKIEDIVQFLEDEPGLRSLNSNLH